MFIPLYFLFHRKSSAWIPDGQNLHENAKLLFFGFFSTQLQIQMMNELKFITIEKLRSDYISNLKMTNIRCNVFIPISANVSFPKCSYPGFHTISNIALFILFTTWTKVTDIDKQLSCPSSFSFICSIFLYTYENAVESKIHQRRTLVIPLNQT